MRGGAVVALVSDAGMPLVSDPGYVLVQRLRRGGARGRGAARARRRRSRRSSPRRCPPTPGASSGFLPRKRAGLVEAFGVGRDAGGVRVAQARGGVAGGARGARPGAARGGLPRADQAARGGRARAGGASWRRATRRPSRAARSCWSSAARRGGRGSTRPRSTRCGGSSRRAPKPRAGGRRRGRAHGRAARTRSTRRSRRRDGEADRAPAAVVPAGALPRSPRRVPRRAPYAAAPAPRRRRRWSRPASCRPSACRRRARRCAGRAATSRVSTPRVRAPCVAPCRAGSSRPRTDSVPIRAQRAAPRRSGPYGPRARPRSRRTSRRGCALTIVVAALAPSAALDRRPSVAAAGARRRSARRSPRRALRSRAGATAAPTSPLRRARRSALLRAGRVGTPAQSSGRDEVVAACGPRRVTHLPLAAVAVRRARGSARARARHASPPASRRPAPRRPPRAAIRFGYEDPMPLLPAPARPLAAGYPRPADSASARHAVPRHGSPRARCSPPPARRAAPGAGSAPWPVWAGLALLLPARPVGALALRRRRIAGVPPVAATGAAVIRRAASLRRPHGLLRHHADLLRQRRAAPRPRVHDDRRRHPRPPQRQRGEEVFFLTGTDEHGEPVAHAAEREGITPKELADRNAQRFQDLMPRHQRLQRLLHPHLRPAPQAARPGGHAAHPRQRARLQGHVRGLVLPPLRGLQDGERDRARATRARSTASRSTASTRRTGSSASRAFQQPLSELYDERPDFVLPRPRYNEARSFITRRPAGRLAPARKLTWGVEVPWDPAHVFYVWFDALLNYYTALSFARDGEDLTERFWPASFHILGKDILKFHAVFWPAMLLAAGIRCREHVLIHGYLLMRDASAPRQDVQVARQRARPVRGDGHVRHGRAALLLLPRGLLRPGRQRLDDHVRRALRDRARQRATATSPAARSR